MRRAILAALALALTAALLAGCSAAPVPENEDSASEAVLSPAEETAPAADVPTSRRSRWM